jgi:hypothetical protein
MAKLVGLYLGIHLVFKQFILSFKCPVEFPVEDNTKAAKISKIFAAFDEAGIPWVL